MRPSTHTVPLLLTLILSYKLTNAAILITSPAPGDTLAAAAPFTITWRDSSAPPSLASLTNYVINLCAGGNGPAAFVCSIGVLKADGAFADGNSVAAPAIAPGVGGEGTNA